MREQTCCFSGHRVLPQEQLAPLSKRLAQTVEMLTAQGYCRFISGGALGFDQLAARVVLSLRALYPHISLLMLLPCRDQAARWSKREQEIYQEILQKSDQVHCLYEHYRPGCMLSRDRAMVEQSSACVYYLTHTRGGTAYTVSYAGKQNLKLINLANEKGDL